MAELPSRRALRQARNDEQARDVIGQPPPASAPPAPPPPAPPPPARAPMDPDAGAPTPYQVPPQGQSPYATPYPPLASSPYQLPPTAAPAAAPPVAPQPVTRPGVTPPPPALPVPPADHAPVSRRGRTDQQPADAPRLLRLAVLPATAALLLAVALTTLVGDVADGLLGLVPVALAAISPLVVLPAIPVAWLAVQHRRWTTLVPVLAAAGLPWFFLLGYVVPADPPAGAALPLRALLVTATDGHADAASVTEAVRAQHADLLVITELSSQLAHDLTVAGLTTMLTPREVDVPAPGASPKAGIGIYSRFPVDRITRLPGTRYPAYTARIMLDRTPVTLVAGHAVRPSINELDDWRRDLTAFAAAGQVPGPVLELVNLHATPWNPQFRRMTGRRLHDAADVLGRGMRPTWPNWTPVPLLPADHALVAGVGVDALDLMLVSGSDHRALAVALRVPRG